MTPEEIEQTVRKVLSEDSCIPEDKIILNDGHTMSLGLIKMLGKHLPEFNGIKWQKIDPENLPEGLVLGLSKKGQIAVGTLQEYVSTKLGINISLDDESLEYLVSNVNHYILLSDLRKLPLEE